MRHFRTATASLSRSNYNILRKTRCLGILDSILSKPFDMEFNCFRD